MVNFVLGPSWHIFSQTNSREFDVGPKGEYPTFGSVVVVNLSTKGLNVLVESNICWKKTTQTESA